MKQEKTLREKILDKLGGVPKEYHAGSMRYWKERVMQLNSMCNSYFIIVREICRRSDYNYYDWCCEFCDRDCRARDGWCERFKPGEFIPKEGSKS